MADRVRNHRHIKEEIEFDTGERYNLYLHSRNQTFLAKWGSRDISGDAAQEVKASMEKLIREESKLEFFPIIIVREHAPFARQVPYIAFTQERTYVAHRPGKDRSLAQIRWDHYNGATDLQQYRHTLIGAPGNCRYRFETLPYISKSSKENSYILAYSDALWDGLEALGELVEQMQAQFRALLGTDTGLLRIEQVGAAALLASGLDGSSDEIDHPL